MRHEDQPKTAFNTREGHFQYNRMPFGLTLNLLTTTIVAPPSNASKLQMGFNSAFKGLKVAPATFQRLI